MSSVLKPYELELDILTGQLVYLPIPNFGYKLIPEGCCVKIPDQQVMMIYKRIEIDGKLLINGDLVFLG